MLDLQSIKDIRYELVLIEAGMCVFIDANGPDKVQGMDQGESLLAARAIVRKLKAQLESTLNVRDGER